MTHNSVQLAVQNWCKYLWDIVGVVRFRAVVQFVFIHHRPMLWEALQIYKGIDEQTAEMLNSELVPSGGNGQNYEEMKQI